MKTQLEKLLSLLFNKEAEIKELQDFILRLQDSLRATQDEYAKLYKLHYLKKARKVLTRKRIGFKTKGGLK